MNLKEPFRGRGISGGLSSSNRHGHLLIWSQRGRGSQLIKRVRGDVIFIQMFFDQGFQRVRDVFEGFEVLLLASKKHGTFETPGKCLLSSFRNLGCPAETLRSLSKSKASVR